jgi:hypothetical protein
MLLLKSHTRCVTLPEGAVWYAKRVKNETNLR